MVMKEHVAQCGCVAMTQRNKLCQALALLLFFLDQVTVGLSPLMRFVDSMYENVQTVTSQ